jgi:hypothetical protein
MPINQFYSTWMRYLQQLHPNERKNCLAVFG